MTSVKIRIKLTVQLFFLNVWKAGSSFPHAFSGNPGESETGHPIKAFRGDTVETNLAFDFQYWQFALELIIRLRHPLHSVSQTRLIDTVKLFRLFGRLQNHFFIFAFAEFLP